ncbi:PAS domain S-box-containing protein [Bradyrhizobium erythrophlei]|nr:PAS domain S-box-containing protein [Bradyrhizobium erythrophlei]
MPGRDRYLDGLLAAETQNALQFMACLGNTAEVMTLAIVLGTSEEDVHAALWPSVRHELIERLAGAYRFVHDRVQEAVYSLIPEETRGGAHLQIGRLLVAHTPIEQREEAIFAIVNQLNRGAALMTSRDEREQLAELNLRAAKRAKASTAYASALNYLVAGATLLLDDSWERRHDLTFELELHRAECEFVTGALTEADERLAALSRRAATTVQRAAVACLQVDLYMTIDQTDRAIAIGLDYLRTLGIDWSPHPTAEEARREYERIWSQLGGRTIEDLVELHSMNDPASVATVDVLIKFATPAFWSPRNFNLFILATCRAVNLSLEQGNSDASCVAYGQLAVFAGPYFGNYTGGFRFGRLGCQLAEKPEFKRFQARALQIFGFVIPWTRHVGAGRDLLRRAFQIANRFCDLTFAAYSRGSLNNQLLFAGDPLVEAQREAESALEFAQKLRFGVVVCWITPQLGLIRSLRGLTAKFGYFDDCQFSELEFERRLSSHLALVERWYWIRKLQARFLAGEYAAAVDASSKAHAQPVLSPIEVEFHFYAALARAAVYDTAPADRRQQHAEALADYGRQLEIWAATCPENFKNRATLVGAEIARIEGRELDAMRLYDQAIRSARANGFVHNEAVAWEVAARFYAARGFENIEQMYLRNARYCYQRWGADGKVRQLDRSFPYLKDEDLEPSPMRTITAPVEHLDLATVIKISQAVSGEIVLEKLLEIIMRTAIAQAGAERGLLILSTETEPHIQAEAAMRGDSVVVQLRDQTVTATELPSSVLHHVLRTRETVILDDAATEPPFAADAYVRQLQARSILCLPLIAQAKLIGALYLENNLATRVFAAARIAVLKLLASQAAIALENARLYRNLAEREAKIRRLVDANIIGIFISRREGDIVEANDAFLKMVGYDREDLAAGRMRWTDLTPPEWLDSTAGALEEINTTGAAQAYEKEYLRKDGSRVPVLIGAAAFDQARDEGVTFVLDLTERKRAETAAREVQFELAHANRVATMGQLAASIAHEVKQPITGAVTNAQAALRSLGRRPYDLEGVRLALARIVEDGHRAGEVVDRIRALIKKTPARNEHLDLNEAILEVIELTRGEAVKNYVSIRTDLAAGLPLIEGDRVQLQQVSVNLIMNAVEAMSDTSDGTRELLISSRKAAPDGVLVTVRDSGPGLASANLDHVFEAFYTTKPGGLGMGLSICRSIIEAHGGRLWASASVPRGATFEFTLPAHPATIS